MTTPPPEDFLPFPEASQATGVPKRTLYRWKEEGRLKAKTIDGKATVSVTAIRALSATRDSTGGSISGAGADNGAGTRVTGTTSALPPGSPPALDGDLAATLFAAFEQGETPIAIVQRLRLPPPLVLAAHAQYSQLRSSTAPTAQQARLDQLEMDRQAMAAEINGLMEAMGRMSRDLAALAARVQALPVPERGAFTCECGNRGWVATPIKCTACGRPGEWGFHPPKQ